MKIFVFLILSSCVRYASTPPKNMAEDFTSQFVPKLDSTAKCALWTGRGAPYPGVDSVLCSTPTTIMYCSAPKDAKPKCEISVDWTPKQAPSPVQAPPIPSAKIETPVPVPAGSKAEVPAPTPTHPTPKH